MFEKILLDMHAILDRCRILQKDLDQKIRQANESAVENRKFKESLDEQAKGMVSREAACKKVEDIQKLHKDAIARHDAANLRVNASVEAEKALNKRVAEENSKLDQKRHAQAKEAQNNERRAKQIDDEVNKRVNEFLVKNGFKK